MAKSTTCSISGCAKSRYARGWCSMHYWRWHRHGDTSVCNDSRNIPTLDRFWMKVQKGSRCWEWTGMKDAKGYGRFRLESGSIAAHRFAYQAVHGPISDELDVDHQCHNKACVNPDHLRAATRSQNLENRIGPNRNGKSGVLNVHWVSARRHWRAMFMNEGRNIYIGSFKTRREAEVAVKKRRIEVLTHNDRDRS